MFKCKFDQLSSHLRLILRLFLRMGVKKWFSGTVEARVMNIGCKQSLIANGKMTTPLCL